MRRHDLVPLPHPLNRRQSVVAERPDIITSPVRRRDKHRVGELAGGATADCAAIWCCCPCMTVNLLVLAVYKVPTAICRKAWRKQRRRMLKNKKKKMMMLAQKQHQEEEEEEDERNHDKDIVGRPSLDDEPDIDKLESSMRSQTGGGGGGGGGGEWTTEEDVEFERKMWGQFKGTGFFRSHSQREI